MKLLLALFLATLALLGLGVAKANHEFVIYSDGQNHMDKVWVEGEGAQCLSLESFAPEGDTALFIYSKFQVYDNQSPVVTVGLPAGCGSFFHKKHPLDLSLFADGELRFWMSVNATTLFHALGGATVKVEVEDVHGNKAAVYAGVTIWFFHEWVEFRFPLQSFRPEGIDFSAIRSPFMITLLSSSSASEPHSVSNYPKLLVDDVRLVDTDGVYTLFSDSVLSWAPNPLHDLTFHSRESVTNWPEIPGLSCYVASDATTPDGAIAFVVPSGLWGCGFEYDFGILDLSSFSTMKFWLKSTVPVKIEYQSDTHDNPVALKAAAYVDHTDGEWEEITLDLDDFQGAFFRERIDRAFMITKVGAGADSSEVRVDGIRFL